MQNSYVLNCFSEVISEKMTNVAGHSATDINVDCTPFQLCIVLTRYTSVDSVDLERCQLGQVQTPRLAEIEACKRRRLYA